MFSQLIPPKGSRTILCGKTGSGKSRLARELLNGLRSRTVVVIDPKGTFDYPGEVAESPSEINDIIKTRRGGNILYRPGIDYMTVPNYDAVLRWVYHTGNITLYIDELYGIADGTKYPESLRALYTRGREKGITVIGATQRPRSVPGYTISECENFFCFELKLYEDRLRMAQMMGEQVKIKSSGHDFFHYKDSMTEPEKMRLELR
jgi:energy-coupling factor transporter ATP-binding protein EcfA2